MAFDDLRFRLRPLQPLSVFRSVLALLVLLAPTGCSRGERTWFAIEHDGMPVGYLVVTDHSSKAKPGEPRLREQDLLLRSRLLGGEFDLRVHEEKALDPATGRPLWVRGRLTAGRMELQAEIRVVGDSARYESPQGGGPRMIPFGPDAQVPDPVDYGFLRGPEGAGLVDSLTLPVLDVARGLLGSRVFTAVGRETLMVAEAPRACRVYRVELPALGAEERVWVEEAGARLVRSRSADGLWFTLADASVKGRVTRWTIDDRIFAPVDLELEDFQAIDRMRVRARLLTLGRRIEAKDLVVPGQDFEGTVEGNRVDGIFTIEHPRFDGSGAAPFPVDYSGRADLRRYLEPELMIESDDPVLVEKARALTEGAGDSWEATLRLSRWVATEIGASVPGASARQTYDAGTGECAAHSRLLAAFCRGVGIPARTATGCMYTPLQGGSFGQHVWNEVYLGDEVGWIPVDTAVGEPDYIDSGHIRLGEMMSFQPEEMEVLEWRLRETPPGE